MSFVKVPECLLKPLNIPEKLMTGPGPANMSKRVVKSLTNQMISAPIIHKETTQLIHEMREGLKYLFQTKNEATFIISGCVTVGVESICYNLLETNDVFLVGNNGTWGERFAMLARRLGIKNVITLDKPRASAFEYDELETAIEFHKPKFLYLTHGETSSGILQPLENIGKLCHRHNCFLIVDAVATAGSCPLYTDELEIDVIFSGPQKVLGTPPGLTVMSLSPLVWERYKQRKEPVLTYVHNWSYLVDFYHCFPDSHTRQAYHHTPNISNFYSLRESLAELCEEGLENCWIRYRKNSELLQKGIEQLGLKLLVKDPNLRLSTITVIEVPEDLNWLDVSSYIMDKYKVEVACGNGRSYDTIWRAGLFGVNACPEVVAKYLKVLDEGIKTIRSRNLKLTKNNE